jgi:trehalose 6-phosphate synthase
VALAEALEQSGGIWIGTTRDIAKAPAEELTSHPGLGFDRLSFDLTAAEHETYYLGYSNSVLWPLFHGRADLLALSGPRIWRATAPSTSAWRSSWPA